MDKHLLVLIYIFLIIREVKHLFTGFFPFVILNTVNLYHFHSFILGYLSFYIALQVLFVYYRF